MSGVGLPLVALSPNSSELNPAGRRFEEARGRVEGRVHATRDATAAGAFLEELVADQAHIRRWDRDWLVDAHRALSALTGEAA